MITIECSGCRRSFDTWPSRIKKYNFCSNVCANGNQHLTQSKWKPWTDAEDKVIHSSYGTEGCLSCARKLSGRSQKSISARASQLGVSGPLRSRAARTDEEWAERFWSYVSRRGPVECWPWTGSRNIHGYGTIRHNFGKGINRSLPSHRVAYQLSQGEAVSETHGYVLHRCGNRACCNPAHLYLGNAKLNAADRDRHGRTQKGEAHYRAKLTEQQVLEIRQLAREGASFVQIASRLSLARHLVSCAATGHTWKHLPGAVPPPGRAVGGKRLLDASAVIRARQMARAGDSIRDIARRLDLPVGEQSVANAVRGRTWKHLDVVEPPVA